MKFKREVITAVAMFLNISCSQRIGGIPPSYPARDYDPRLTRSAELIVPLIHALDLKIQATQMVPDSLDGLSSSISVPEGTYYSPEQMHYRIGVKLGWDTSLWYDSRTRAWTFDPGDGGPEKPIKLRTEPSVSPNPPTSGPVD
jgi:hypothetical protein